MMTNILRKGSEVIITVMNAYQSVSDVTVHDVLSLVLMLLVCVDGSCNDARHDSTGRWRRIR